MRTVNKYLATDDILKLNKECPLNEYPRPSFVRDSYLCLNGEWDYCTTYDKNSRTYEGKILVPYCIESLNSGVQKSLKKDEFLIYHRTFNVDKNFIKDITILNILGIDEEFEVIINNYTLPYQVSVCLPIRLDISNYIKEGENDIIIICKDNLKKELPQGKQVRKPKGMFYTAVSGIYYPLFIESYASNHIESIKITPTLSSITLEVDTQDEYSITIYDKEEIIYKNKTKKFINEIEISSPHLWSIEDPFLYKIELSTKDDTITSYFGLRTVKIIDQKVYLNNKEIFLNGLLDQGYYPEGIYTVSSYDSYEKDIVTMKELGFNMLRKHIKIELPYFYYLCDKHGMLVMQDFVNNGTYKYIHDTVLPTIGFQTFKDNKGKSLIEHEMFIKHATEVINYLYNCPSVIAYTIYNEGWGQYKADETYNLLKPLDKTRLYDATSGWFRQKFSDFESRHIYFKNITKKLSKEDKKIFLSEFGGYIYKIPENSFNLKNTYGYKLLDTQEEFEKEFFNLYEEIISNKDKLVGTVYTQVSDVEDETNGLFTYDRKVLKLDKNKTKNLMDRLTKNTD